jgi:hypothetical protein
VAKAKHPNINVHFYGCDLDVILECPFRCALARFFTEPPEADDDCAFLRPGQACGHMSARMVALTALYKRIGKEIEEANGEDGEVANG